MANKKLSFFETKRGKTIMNTAYCVGAAVVIVGAWAKILHLPIANTMLTVGLLTEAVIFLISVMEPQYDFHAEPEWERVYPELAEDGAPIKKGDKPLTQQLDKMLSDAKVGPDLINSLGKGLNSLADHTGKLGELTNATVAANEFANNAKAAAGQITTFASAAASATSAVGEIAKGSQDTKVYQEQVQNMAKNLTQLNAIYENELKDSNNHLKSMNKFFANLNNAAQALSETATDATKYKDQMVTLNKNLSALNTVYGNMLSAMRTNG